MGQPIEVTNLEYFGAAIIMPGVNTEAMNEHLAEISTQVAADAHRLLVCDGAGWHQQGERPIVRDNITLLPLIQTVSLQSEQGPGHVS